MQWRGWEGGLCRDESSNEKKKKKSPEAKQHNLLFRHACVLAEKKAVKCVCAAASEHDNIMSGRVAASSPADRGATVNTHNSSEAGTLMWTAAV